MIVVRTFGSPEIRVGTSILLPSSEVMFGLACYLAVRAGTKTPRDVMAELFWPSASAEGGRHSLRQMLYRLRRLGFSLEETATSVAFNALEVDCDARVLLSPAWPGSVSEAELLADGDFLAGYHPGFSAAFHEWIETQRDLVGRQRRLGTLVHLAAARNEGRWPALETLGGLLQRLDPLSEEAALARAESAAMLGSKSRALELLDSYVSELGDRSKLVALPATTLRRRISERQGEWGLRGSVVIPLLGRADEMRRISELVSAARNGRGGSLIVVGAPGIGKTRLCDEAALAASLVGCQTIRVRADAADRGRPLSLALRLATQINDLPGVAGCTPTAMAILRRVAEETIVSSQVAGTTSTQLTIAQISWALSEALAAAGEERLVLIQVDDLHNADEGSESILHALATCLSTSRVALLSTARFQWVHSEDPRARKWAQVPRLTLQSLEPEAARQFATHLCVQLGLELHPDALESVIGISAGNPLFLTELASHRAHDPSGKAHPASLSRLIEHRLSQLNQRQLRLLRLVVVLGGLSNIPRLSALASDKPSRLSTDLEILEGEGLIQLDHGGRLALHECWRDAVESSMPRGAQAALSFECAKLLLEDVDADGSVALECLWHAADLFAQCGAVREAFGSFSEAGTRLIRMGFPTQAVQAFTRAIELSRGAASAESLSRLATAQHAASMYSGAALTCEKLLSLTGDDTKFLALRATALAILADSRWKADNSCGDALDSLAKIVIHPDLPAPEKNICCLFGIRLTFAHDQAWANRFATAAVVNRQSVIEDWVGLTTRLIFAAESGRAADVRAIVTSLRSQELRSLPAQSRVMVLRYCATSLRFVGEIGEAMELAESALTSAVAAGLQSDAVASCFTLAFGHLDHNKPEQAEDWIERASALSGSQHYDERERSLRHAYLRVYVASGRQSKALGLGLPAMNSMLEDPMASRKAIECACLALAAARDGQLGLAARLGSVVSEILRDLTPRFQLDFAADSLVEVLKCTSCEEQAERVRADYLRRRTASFSGPIAPAFTSLLHGPRTTQERNL